MILGMWSIYTKYLDKINKADKERNEICTCALGLEKKLHITNEKREQGVTLFQQQTVKLKYYKRMIDVL